MGSCIQTATDYDPYIFFLSNVKTVIDKSEKDWSDWLQNVGFRLNTEFILFYTLPDSGGDIAFPASVCSFLCHV